MTTLRQRLLVPTGLLSVLAVGALALLGWDSARGTRALRETTDEVRAASALALALTEASQDRERLLLARRARGAHAALDARLTEAIAREAEIVSRIEARGLPSSAAALWAEYLRARAALRAVHAEILDASAASHPDALALAYEKWGLLGDRANALLYDFTVLHLRLLDATIADLQRRREQGLWAAGAAVLAGVLLAAGFAVALARSVVQPIVHMAKAAEEISQDESLRVPGADRPDELGILARSLNAMTGRLVASNARLAEAVRARDEFLSIASHELKTPLTPIQLRLDQMLKAIDHDPGQLSREAVARTAETLRRQVSRMGKLVGNLLDVSRISSGKLALDVQEVSVADLLDDVADDLAEELAAAGCELRIERARELGLRGDRLRLEQVLSNLLANAARYAPGTTVVVRARADAEGRVELEVDDAGPGIAPSDHERIFSRFERAGDREGVSGLGLGLYIAREIVRAHGGELSVASEPGRGARFTVRLPVDGAAPGGAARLPLRPPAR